MEDRVLILASRGRDAAIAADLLTRHGLNSLVCADQAEVIDAVRAGAGSILLTEEALTVDDPAQLIAWVAEQPKWSDIPFVVLANGAPAPRTASATAVPPPLCAPANVTGAARCRLTNAECKRE